MALTLYLHPLASFCHKVLIALYENGTEFRAETVDFSNPGDAAAQMERWPVGKIPVLHDSRCDLTLPETSIIIEYLQQHYPGPVTLLPADPEAALNVRLWDRFYDLYVQQPMQRIVGDRIRSDGSSDPYAVAEARKTLDTAYAMIDAKVGEGWAAGADFGMADCAAFPGLFFASIVHPFKPEQTRSRAYFERLLARPSVQRVLDEARSYFPMFPYVADMPARFL